MEKITILHAKTYNFTDDKTGKSISGLKLAYILNDDLEPLKIDENERGYGFVESTMPLELATKIMAVPGVYEAKFVNTTNAKKQIVQKPVDLTFICTVPELFGQAKATTSAAK